MLNRLKFKGISYLRWIHFILDKCQRPTQFLLYEKIRESHESSWRFFFVCVCVCASSCVCSCVHALRGDGETGIAQTILEEQEREKASELEWWASDTFLQTLPARWVTLAEDQLTRGVSASSVHIYGSEWLHITDPRSFITAAATQLGLRRSRAWHKPVLR